MKKTKDLLPSPPRVKTKEKKKERKRSQRLSTEVIDENETGQNEGKTMEEIHDEIRKEVEEVASFKSPRSSFYLIYREETFIYLSQG